MPPLTPPQTWALPTSLDLGFAAHKTDRSTCKTVTKWKALCDLCGEEGRLLTYANNVLFWARPGATATRVAWETSARNRRNTLASEDRLWIQLAADKGSAQMSVPCSASGLASGVPTLTGTPAHPLTRGTPAWNPVYSPPLSELEPQGLLQGKGALLWGSHFRAVFTMDILG